MLCDWLGAWGPAFVAVGRHPSLEQCIAPGCDYEGEDYDHKDC